MTYTKFLKTAAIAALCISAPLSAKAETVHTETHVKTQDLEGVQKVNFSDFDLNNDGTFSKEEVGEHLYYLFDQDGNEVIDNIEWSQKNVYTITPMEKETYKFIDYNGDGYTDVSTYSYDTFYEESGLIMFDKNKNGWSAEEFIETSFQELDDNDNNIIDLEEWKAAYTEMTIPEVAKQDKYN